MKRGDLVALFHVLSWVAVISIGFAVAPRLPIPRDIARTLGAATFLPGMALFFWALAHLKRAFFGNVEPVTDRLVRSGPYRWVRHPIYLAMAMATLGLVLALRSPWGLAGVCLLFVPAGAYRARLEDKTLARKFGRAWEDYAEETAFLLPPFW